MAGYKTGWADAIKEAEFEIRRVEKRNTETVDGKPNTWNRAVKTMADECVDSIKTMLE
jgi:hypothetical protein